MAWIFSPTEEPRECPLLHVGAPSRSKRLLSGAFVDLVVVVVEAANPFIIASDRTMAKLHTVSTKTIAALEECSKRHGNRYEERRREFRCTFKRRESL
jgi:hypothetical protein